MEKKSFIKQTVIMMTVQMSLLIIVLLFFLLSSYSTTRQSMNQLLDNFLQVYGNELESKIKIGDRILERLVYKNTDYSLMQSDSESDRYYASVNLRKLLDESIINEEHVDMVVIAERDYKTCLDAENTKMTMEQRNAIRRYALQCTETEELRASWTIKEIEDTLYLYKMYVWQGRVAGVFIMADSFMDTAVNSKLKDMTLLLVDGNQKIHACYGKNEADWKTVESIEDIDTKGELEMHCGIGEESINVYAYLSMSGMSGQIKSSMVVFLIIICCSTWFSAVLIRYIRTEILIPMKNMKDNMEIAQKKIQDGNYQLRILENYNNSEFMMLKNTFNKLMDEIVGLKIKSYEKQIEMQETELRCVRLQIRPHFFLNAMTTISSLSMQGKNKEIRVYIDALTKNIRYMFRSGLHTVKLAEEIRHVENYFEMQELKYPQSVFYYIEMEEELGEWCIPQMIIHTIIENEYKYAVSIDSMLTILIKISKIQREGETLLSIEIEDDGKGYPDDVIENFYRNEAESEKDGSRIGLWSVKRMMRLMYEREDLFLISNIKPHGCLNHFLVPEQALHEVRHETAQNKLD